jgi:hypothetical protein
MTKRAHRFLPLFFVVALLVPSAGAQTPPAAGEDPALWKAYYNAVSDSAVYNVLNLRILKPVIADGDGNVLVVSLKGSAYPIGLMQTTGDIWITLVPEVQNECKQYPSADAPMRLRMLLGLPPYSQSNYGTFNVMKVAASALFRPSPDPETGTVMPCPKVATGGVPFPPNCGNFFPPGTPTPHITWMANNNLSSYQSPALPPNAKNTNGYPWTRLGYTYNWYSGPGANKYGASEYIIPQGTYVTVLSTPSVAAYCAP